MKRCIARKIGRWKTEKEGGMFIGMWTIVMKGCCFWRIFLYTSVLPPPPPQKFLVFKFFFLKKKQKKIFYFKKMFFICIVVRVKIMLKHRHGQKE